MGMVEFLGNLHRPGKYFNEFANKAGEMSDFQLGKEIAARQEPKETREAIARFAVIGGSAVAAYEFVLPHVIPIEARLLSLGPVGLGVILSSATRGIVRSSEERILHGVLEQRYPAELTIEASPNYKPLKRDSDPVQVFPSPQGK